MQQYPAGSLVPAVLATIRHHRLFTPRESVLVAVSGGPDSVCVLHCLQALRGTVDLRLHVAHVHHGLRGTEADEDTAFVVALAGSYGLPCSVLHVDVPALRRQQRSSVQDAARRGRYAALRGLAASIGATGIVTAHTQDDQAETLLLHLLRGSGLDGLAGMRLRQGDLVRPLLEQARGAIELHCQVHGLAWRQDASNSKRQYRRNALRLDVLPALEAYNPQVREALSRCAALLALDADFMRAQAAAALESVLVGRAANSSDWPAGPATAVAWQNTGRLQSQDQHVGPDHSVSHARYDPLEPSTPDIYGPQITIADEDIVEPTAVGVSLPCDRSRRPSEQTSEEVERSLVLDRARLMALPAALRLHVLRLALERIAGSTERFSQAHVQAIDALAAGGRAGRCWQLPRRVRAEATAHDLRLAIHAAEPAPDLAPLREVALPVPGTVQCGCWTIEAAICTPDPARAPRSEAQAGRHEVWCHRQAAAHLVVRGRRPGDRLRPLGLGGTKKLQDLFVDRKVPRWERDVIPVVDGANGIVWVIGVALAESARLRDGSGEAVRLRAWCSRASYR